MDTRADRTPLAISLAFTESARHFTCKEIIARHILLAVGIGRCFHMGGVVGGGRSSNMGSICQTSAIYVGVSPCSNPCPIYEMTENLTCAHTAMMTDNVPPEAHAKIMLMAITAGIP